MDPATATAPTHQVIADELLDEASRPGGHGLDWEGYFLRLAELGLDDGALRRALAPAAAAALGGAIRDGAWYRGVRFVIVFGEGPHEREQLRLLLADPAMDLALRELSSSPGAALFTPSVAQDLSEQARSWVARFISLAPREPLRLPLRHQIAGALLAHLAPESHAFADVARVLLDCLLEAEMPGLAFVAWLSLADVAPALRGEVRYCVGMRDYVEACLAESADPPALLAHMVGSDVLLTASGAALEVEAALRAVALRCLVECGSPQAAGLLQSPGSWSRTAPQLTRLMLFLARQAPAGPDTPMLAAALRLREKVGALAQKLELEPEYHGVSVAQRVWRALKSERLEPLYVELRQPGGPQAPRSQALRAIDVDELIGRHPENARDPLDNHVYRQLKSDLGEALGSAADAFELLEERPVLAHLVSGYEQQRTAIDAELKQVASLGSLADWAVERMVRPVLLLEPLVANSSPAEG